MQAGEGDVADVKAASGARAAGMLGRGPAWASILHGASGQLGPGGYCWSQSLVCVCVCVCV